MFKAQTSRTFRPPKQAFNGVRGDYDIIDDDDFENRKPTTTTTTAAAASRRRASAKQMNGQNGGVSNYKSNEVSSILTINKLSYLKLCPKIVFKQLFTFFSRI